MRSWDEIGEKLSVRFKRYLDGEDAFASRWNFNKVLRALQKLERLTLACVRQDGRQPLIRPAYRGIVRQLCGTFAA